MLLTFWRQESIYLHTVYILAKTVLTLPVRRSLHVRWGKERLKMKSRSRIYVTRQIPQSAVDVLLQECNVSFWDSYEPVPRGELLNNVRGVDALICMPTDKIDRDVLDVAGRFLNILFFSFSFSKFWWIFVKRVLLLIFRSADCQGAFNQWNCCICTHLPDDEINFT